MLLAGRRRADRPRPDESVGRLLEALGDFTPEAILITHIHLDHAGATGSLPSAGRTSPSTSTSSARRT